MEIETSNEPDTFSGFEHAGWQQVSEGYERHFANLTRQTANVTLDAAGVSAKTRMLDVCTGPGILPAAAADRGACVLGLDFSAEAVALARRTVPDAEFVEGDAAALPFADGSFDAVTCGYGLIHLPDPGRALSEMRRVLRPGGRMATSVWIAPAPGNGFGLIYGAIGTHARRHVGLPHGPDFFQFSAAGHLAAGLEATGFIGVEVTAVEQSWEFDAPTDLLTALLEGAVRVRGLLLAQDEPTRLAIAENIRAGMERDHRTAAGRYAVPMPALVGSGAR